MSARFLLMLVLILVGGISVAWLIWPEPHRQTVAVSQETLEASDHFVRCRNGVVVTISAPASSAGLVILKDGGNAVDAAVATAFALAVSFPPAGNLGGGGFMLVHPAPGDGDPTAFDYRESAPAASTPTMFAKNESQHTHKAVATPGTVRGMALAHQRFGKLPWSRLLQPAIELARGGFLINARVSSALNEILKESPGFAELQRVYGKPGGGQWAVGDHLIQPDLAKTLQILADEGPDVFYKGRIADAIIAEIAQGRGLITARDLVDYRAIERKPLTTRYRGTYDVYAPPLPSSGGMCLIEELHMLEPFDLKAWGRWSPKTIHVMAEAMRRANYDRARYFGDPAFTQIPPHLSTREHGRQLAGTIDLNKATRSEALATDITLSQEGMDTTHLSIIDGRGMAVSNTYTLERLWGSRIVVKGMGFLLNNDMFAFNHFPGVTDKLGGIGTTPNTIAPGKRPLTSQTPTIVAKDGRVQLVTGTPGSRAIPHTVLCILVNTLDFEIPLRDAVEMQRFSHQWFPDQISLEESEHFPELCKALTEMGHVVVRFGPLPQGDAHSIWVAGPNKYVGVADKRRSGKAAGY